jgi:hypothetical protein
VSARALAGFALLGCALLRASSASPIDELRSASAIANVDVQKLKRGDIANARGPLGEFVRGVYVESAYFVRAPVGTVAATLLHWDASRHRELEVSAFRDYKAPSGADVFNSFTLTSNRSADRWLIDKTWDLTNASAATELHLSSPEIASIRSSLGERPAVAAQRDAKATDVWRKVLHDRSDALGNAGLAAVRSYRSADAQISARAEFESLLKMAPAVASRFETLTACKPFAANGNGPDESAAYWEASLVRGHTGLHNGLISLHKAANSWQAIDLSYYTSDTYYMSATLYEMWPQDEGTLVWQIDFVSAPFHSFSAGIEKMFAGREMLKETEQWIRLFRSDVEAAR